MKLISKTGSLRHWATVLCTSSALACLQPAIGQVNRPPLVQPSGPPPAMYTQRPQATGQRVYSVGPAAGRPNYAQAPGSYAQPSRNYAGQQPMRNYGGQQNASPQGYPPQGYGYGQRPASPNPYGQRGAMPASGYGQNGQVYSQNRGTPQTVPNRNATYTGMADPARQNAQQRFWQQQPNNLAPNATRGEHLQQWMEHHNSLNTQDQQRALQREPGFNQLPQQTQQRMLDRLQRLNSMPADQRERVLERSEQMERLTPAQRGEVRGAMGQLGALPQDRRRAVAHSFRELRSLPPEQRNQVLNSPEYRQQFNDQERNTLNHLLTVSPMLPQQ